MFEALTRQFSGWSLVLVESYEAYLWQDWHKSRVSLHRQLAQDPGELIPL